MICLFIKNIFLWRNKAINSHKMKLSNYFWDIHYHPVVYSGILVCAFDLKRHSRILEHSSRISEQSKSNRPTNCSTSTTLAKVLDYNVL